MADLTNTLLQAAQADRAAEQRLNEWLSSNYGELVKALVAEIARDDSPLQARQMAAIYLKNTLYGKTPKTQGELHARWKQLPAPVRTVVKEGLMAAMRTSTEDVAHYCSIAAAEVATVELPYQEWPTFLPTLTEFVTNATAPVAIQQAALQCLGYTCERIAEVEEKLDVPELPVEIVDKMLTTIVNGVGPGKSDGLRFVALQALKNSLVFVRKNMDMQGERDFIMRNAIMEATRATEPRVRSLAFACLDQVAELYYEHLQDYMKDIFNLTLEAIANDPDESVKVAAIEFWSTVALVEQNVLDEEELARQAGQPLDRPPCNKYTLSALGMLVPLLLGTLSQQDEHADDDDAGLNSTGALCIQTISQTVEAAIIPIVMPFVNQNITNQDWHLRDAAIIAFSCILDGPDTEAVGQYVVQSIPVLLATFNDPNETVRQSAVHCLSTICKLHAAAIQPGQVLSLLESLLLKLQESPRVATYACSAIYNIARSLRSVAGEPSNLLSAPMLPLLQALFQVNDREDSTENNLRRTSLEAAGELISSSAMDVQNILRELLPTIIDRVDVALKMPVLSADDQDQKANLLGLLCIIYQALFRRLEKEDVLPVADRIMGSLLQILQIPNAVCHDEAFMATAALADVVEEQFAKYLDHIVPLVIAGMRNFEATSMCKVAIGTLVDISVNVGVEIQRFCDQIMATLMECLKDNSVDRSVKPVVISCLGDIALAIGGAFEPYLQVTTMLLMQAAQQQAPPEDEEMVMFINELRFAVLEAYSGILLGLDDGGKLQLFLPNVQNIIAFLQYLAAPHSNHDAGVLTKAATLLGDIARLLGTQDLVRPVLAQAFVIQLLTECSEIGGDEGRQTATWAHEQVQKALQG